MNNMSKKELIQALKQQIVETENQKLFNYVQKEIETKKRKHSIDAKIASEKFEIYKIVMTGGPCAGKTTSIINLAEKLREQGFAVYIVPETA